jgi:hypothetical protein
MSFRSHGEIEELAGDGEIVAQALDSAAGAARLASPLANSTAWGSARWWSTPPTGAAKIDGFSASRCRSVNDKPFTGFRDGARSNPSIWSSVFGPGRRIGFSSGRRGKASKPVKSASNDTRYAASRDVGSPIDEPPNIPDYHDPRSHGRLVEGLVPIDRPIIAAASGRVVLYRPQEGLDGGGLSGRYEHTVVITKMAFDPIGLGPGAGFCVQKG